MTAYYDRITILQPFSGARAPRHGQPNMCATKGALGVSSPMVVEYIHSRSVIFHPYWPLTFSEPFLSCFSSHFPEFGRFWTYFPLFRATGNRPKAHHVQSYGVREAFGMYLGRPGPWAGLGKGISSKISRAPRHTPIADLHRFRRRGPPRSQKKSTGRG
jgi:hypothetical protein